MSCAPYECNCCIIPQVYGEDPCRKCPMIKCDQNTSCKVINKPRKGEPPCGCIYGCPCKAACYDWNPCVKPFSF